MNAASSISFRFVGHGHYQVKVKVKVKFSLEQATKAQRGSRCIALSLTSALDGVGGQVRAPADFPPGKTRYALYTGLGGPQGRSGHVRKFSPPQEFGLPDRSGSI